MVRFLFSIIISSFLFFSVSAQNTEWAVSFGGPLSEKGISIGTDTLGFIYASGYFNTSATFGSITLSNSSPSGANKEVFLVKMDSTGNVIWAMAGGDGSGSCCDDRALGMHVTPDGFVFMTGTFWSTFDIGTCSVGWSQANSHDSSLLTKIDPNGNCVWARSFGADEGQGSGPGCPYPIYDADDHSYDVKVDGDGFIYITGFFSGVSAEFDAITLTNPLWGAVCEPLGYVAKLDANGDFIWAHKYDGIKDQRGSRDNRIAIDHFSNVYIVGGFQNTGTYGPFTLTSNGEWDAVLFKMDKDGNFIWAKNVGSDKTDRANGIAIDYCDNVYISGEYRNPMVFEGANASNGTDTLSHNQKRDIFVAKITTNGDWVWAKRARSKGTDKPYQMSVDENMQVYIAGSAGDSLKFNSSITLSKGDTSINAFVAQLDGSRAGDWVWAKMGGSLSDDDRAGDICEDGGSNLYAVGFYEQTADLDGVSLTSLGKKDVFVWKLKKAVVTPKQSNCIYVDVQPAGAGYVNMNGTDITLFPCLQNVDDSATHNFDAIANAGYTFDNWDWDIHSPLPNTTNPNSTVYTFSDDTLIVNFSAIVTDTIIYIVQPAGAGQVTIDGTTVSSFPHTGYYTQGDTSSLSALPNAGYGFTNWDFQNNTPLPNDTTVNIDVVWGSNDTVYINFDTIPTYSVTYIANPALGGTVTVDGTIISAFPTTLVYAQGANSSLVASANAGFTFVDYNFQNNAPLPNSTTASISTTWLNDDTVYINFDTIPSYNVTYYANPVAGGTITVDGTVITAFPTTLTYSQGTTSTLLANPNAGFNFVDWNFQNNAALPNTIASSITSNWMSDDTVTANFSNIPMSSITYLTDPVGAGSIDIDGTNQAVFPYTETYVQGTNVILDANANPNFSFFNWSSNAAVLNPSNQNVLVDFNAPSIDTIIAHYKETDTLWVITQPAGTAQLEVGSDVITTSPYMGLYELGSLLPVNITPYSGNIFNQWDLIPTTLPDYSPSTSFLFVGQDTLIASLNNVLAIQDLGDDLQDVSLFPNLVSESFQISIDVATNTDIEINLINISGQKLKNLYSGSLNGNSSFLENYSLDVSAGIYFVQVRTLKSNITFKVVKI